MIGDIESISETTYGFRTKFFLFAERIEKLRLELQKQKSEIRVLDVGCSNGVQMTFPLAKLGYHVTGIDFYEPSIVFAKKNNIFKNAEFFLQRSEELEEIAGEKKFDAVILSDILEHVVNPAELLRKIRAILVPNGMVLISIPNGFGPFEIENFFLRKSGILRLARRMRHSGEETPYNHENGHIQFFTQSSFKKIVQKAGFSINFFQKGCFLGGSATSFFINRIPPMRRLNIRLGKYLPADVVSVWYFELR